MGRERTLVGQTRHMADRVFRLFAFAFLRQHLPFLESRVKEQNDERQINLCDINLCDINLRDINLCDINLCDINLCAMCDTTLTPTYRSRWSIVAHAAS